MIDPTAPAEPHRPTLRRSVAAGWYPATLLAVATVAALARASPAGRFSLWAEDAAIFVQQSRHRGFIQSLFTSYNGYFHLLPRVVAGLALPFPLRWTPEIYSVLSALIAAGCAFIAAGCGRRLGLSRPAVAILAVAVLLLPAGGFEILNTVTNLQWHVLPAAVVFLAAWTRGFRPPAAVTGLLLVVAGLTTPLLVVCLPFVVLRTLTRREPLDILVASVLAVTSAIQIAGRWVGAAPPPDNHHLHAARLTQLYALKVIDEAFVGSRLLGALRGTIGARASVVIGIAVFFLLLVFSLVEWLRSRPVPLFLLSASVLLYAVPATLRSVTSVPFLPLGFTDFAARYSAAPTICILLFVLAGIDQRIHGGGGPSPRREGEVLMALACLILVLNFPVDTGRFSTKSWSDAIARGKETCRTSPSSIVTVGVAPDASSWRITLSCREAYP